MVHYPILGSRKNGGPGVQALWTKARPWRLQSIRAQPLAHFWFLFVRAKRNSPQGETLLRKAGTAFPTVSFGAVKRNGVGKKRFSRASALGFGFSLCEQKETRRQAKAGRCQRPGQGLDGWQGPKPLPNRAGRPPPSRLFRRCGVPLNIFDIMGPIMVGPFPSGQARRGPL